MIPGCHSGVAIAQLSLWKQRSLVQVSLLFLWLSERQRDALTHLLTKRLVTSLVDVQEASLFGSSSFTSFRQEPAHCPSQQPRLGRDTLPSHGGAAICFG